MSKAIQRTIPVAENGRMNLPADMRRALGLTGSGYLLAILEGDAIRLTTISQTLNQIQRLAAPFKPEGYLVSESLLEERRAEAESEDTGVDKHG